jgi:hypothetical protein
MSSPSLEERRDCLREFAAAIPANKSRGGSLVKTVYELRQFIGGVRAVIPARQEPGAPPTIGTA